MSNKYSEATKEFLEYLFSSLYDLSIKERNTLLSKISYLLDKTEQVPIIVREDEVGDQKNVLVITSEGIKVVDNNGDLIGVTSKTEFDAIVDINGYGDYTTIQDAWNDGHRKLFIRSGEYIVNGVLPLMHTPEDNMPVIIGEDKYKTIIKFNRKKNSKDIPYGQSGFYIYTVAKKYRGDYKLKASFYVNEYGYIESGYFRLEINNIDFSFSVGDNIILFFPDIEIIDVFKIIDISNNEISLEFFQDLLQHYIIMMDMNIVPDYLYQIDISIFEVGIPAKEYYRLEDVSFNNIDLSRNKSERIISATDGNFTRSVKDGLYIQVGWEGTMHIEKVLDSNTILLKEPLEIYTETYSLLNPQSWYVGVGLESVVLKNVSLYNYGNYLFNFHQGDYYIIKKFIVDSVRYEGEYSFNWDAVGKEYYVINSEFYRSNIHLASNSIAINCKGDGLYYFYMPNVIYIGCNFYQEGLWTGSEKNVYIGCSFNVIRNPEWDFGTNQLIGCVFKDGEVYSTSPDIIEVKQVKFPNGVLSSTTYGLVYRDNDFSSTLVNIIQDKYTWNINGEVLITNNVDGYRKITFTGNIVKVNVISMMSPNSSLVINLKVNNEVVKTITTTIPNFTEVLNNINVNEDDLISIDIVDVQGIVYNTIVEVIERS